MNELAQRENDGLRVTLWWMDGETFVTVNDTKQHKTFEVKCPPDKALDYFYHPYAYELEVKVSEC